MEGFVTSEFREKILSQKQQTSAEAHNSQVIEDIAAKAVRPRLEKRMKRKKQNSLHPFGLSASNEATN